MIKNWRDLKGDWNNEPDRAEFEAHGFHCIARRNPSCGHWCGYVGVTANHPYYGKYYGEIDIDVHGGLTYSDHCNGEICHKAKEGEPDELYWLGFDCGHFDDLSPYQVAIPSLAFRLDGHYWTLEEVEEECISLAKQLLDKRG